MICRNIRVLRNCLVLCVCLLLAAAHSVAATFYIDSRSGNDGNSGRSPAQAWKSLAKVNDSRFSPGDRILLSSGGVWAGQLRPASSGAPGRPVLIDRYGSGSLPRIDGGGAVDDAVLLRNVQNIEIGHLEITNQANTPAPRRGVHIVLDNFGTARHIVVAELYIHDISGTNAQKDNGGIIFTTLGSRTPSRFDGLLIRNNLLWRVDRSAIAAASYHADRTRWFPSLHVVIRDNYAEDIGGDGIVPWATDRAVIEHNIVRYCNHRAGSYNAGIWPWSTDNSIFQLNEASFTQTTKDGEGFDSDFNSRNTLFQYNFSHDNEGGFMLICTPVKRDAAHNIGNSGTVIRNNISWNDHSRLVNLSGADDTTVEHNIFFIAPGDEVQALLVSQWEGWSHNAVFRGNTFYVAGRAVFGHEVKRDEAGRYTIAAGWGPAEGIRFADNRYVGPNAEAPVTETETVEKPGSIPPTPDGEPAFDPSNPAGFDAFMAKHRAWMLRTLRDRFGMQVKLLP